MNTQTPWFQKKNIVLGSPELWIFKDPAWYLVRGRSQIMMTRFCALLTTYLSTPVDILLYCYTVKSLYTVDISSTTYILADLILSTQLRMPPYFYDPLLSELWPDDNESLKWNSFFIFKPNYFLFALWHFAYPSF